METPDLFALTVCVLLLVFVIKNALQLNKTLDLVKKKEKRFYDLVNLCRDELRETNVRVEYFETTLSLVVQNLAKDPLFYNRYYASTNGTHEFSYEDVVDLVTDYDAHKAKQEREAK